MHTANNKKPGSLNVRQPLTAQPKNASLRKPPVVQLKSNVSAQSVKRPVAPPVYKPQPPQRFVQRKIAAAPGVDAVVFQRVIQRSAEGNGNPGGKGGMGYSSVGGAYSEEEQAAALAEVGIKGVKGHGKGRPGSKESGQTKKEMAAVVEVLREKKAVAKVAARGCREFHKRANLGEECPTCHRDVTKEML